MALAGISTDSPLLGHVGPAAVDVSQLADAHRGGERRWGWLAQRVGPFVVLSAKAMQKAASRDVMTYALQYAIISGK